MKSFSNNKIYATRLRMYDQHVSGIHLQRTVYMEMSPPNQVIGVYVHCLCLLKIQKAIQFI